MAGTLRPIGHDDRLSLVEHLTELRTRLILCLIVFGVAFGFCFWQNDAILDLMNQPLYESARSTEGGRNADPLEASATFDDRLEALAVRTAAAARALQAEDGVSPRTRAAFREVAEAADAAARAAPNVAQRRPITTGVGEPFTTTFRVASYAALLFSLPFLLYQLYAFVLPAFSPRERQVALPLMLMVPFLFVAGVAFGYLVLLPRAIDFLQNFNDDNFDILLQARDYYGFTILVLLVMGLCFQVPVGILAVTRVGIVTVDQLRKGRRYAILVIAILAMLLPGQDPVTMVTMMIPLVLLYEGSILLASALDRRAERARAREEADLAALDPDLERPDDRE